MDLPVEMIADIFDYLDNESLFTVSKTCNNLASICKIIIDKRKEDRICLIGVKFAGNICRFIPRALDDMSVICPMISKEEYGPEFENFLDLQIRRFKKLSFESLLEVEVLCDLIPKRDPENLFSITGGCVLNGNGQISPI